MSQQQPVAALIYPAIIEIMRAVGPITKDERNEQQKFNYRGIDKVYNAVHPLFAEHGVFSTSTIIKTEHREGVKKGRDGDKSYMHAILSMRFTFWAADGSHVETEVVGEGVDYSGDKASNKAMSIADKYAILQILKIPTAMIDPDRPTAHDNPDRDETAPTAQTRNQRRQQPAEPVVSVDELAEIAAAWKKLNEMIIETGELADPRAAYLSWILKTAGRQFNPGQRAEWTPADVARCRAALKLDG